ncbi:hypothetical protein AP058_03115 [Flavobacterium sp. TAB 87]|nr:hypothetical protein AP058_03115 [Flavobacterium sp. TAB 87]
MKWDCFKIKGTNTTNFIMKNVLEVLQNIFYAITE